MGRRRCAALAGSSCSPPSWAPPCALLTRPGAPSPCSLDAARWDRLKKQSGSESVQQQLMRSVVSLPAGGAYAALPFWPQALEVLQIKVGAKLLGSGATASRTAGVQPAGRGWSLHVEAGVGQGQNARQQRGLRLPVRIFIPDFRLGSASRLP